MRGENRSTRGKTSQSKEENQQTQPTIAASLEIEHRATLVGGNYSHYYIPTALQLVVLSTSTSVSVLIALCFKKVCFCVVRNFTFMIQPEKKFLQI